MSKPSPAPAPTSVAERQVQSLIDAFVRRRSGAHELVVQVTRVCREQPAATWQALSLLDQLHRRQRLSADLFRTIKKALNQIVFNSTGAYAVVPPTSGHGPDLRMIVGGLAKHDDFDVTTIDALEPLVLPAPANAHSFQALRLGELLHDRYVIVEPLSAGSASVTFKALDRHRASQCEAERYVAIRWLDEHLQSDPHAVMALQNEYAQWQAIAHPNIPKAYEIRAALGACSIVLELPAGEFLHCLSERIAPARWSLEHALTLVREIGAALLHAHASGVVHGNLHLGSVLITHSGAVRVYDFAPADAWASRDVPPDRQDTVPLTARRYCSPQRLSAMTACAADDLYSLAAIAYELLCAQPFDVDALRSSWRPVHARHLRRRQWQALRRVLLAEPDERGSVSDWLVELGADHADFKLPTLIAMTTQAEPANRYRLPRWF